MYQFDYLKSMTTQFTFETFTKKSTEPFFVSRRQRSRERWQSIRNNGENYNIALKVICRPSRDKP